MVDIRCHVKLTFDIYIDLCSNDSAILVLCETLVESTVVSFLFVEEFFDDKGPV